MPAKTKNNIIKLGAVLTLLFLVFSFVSAQTVGQGTANSNAALIEELKARIQQLFEQLMAIQAQLTNLLATINVRGGVDQPSVSPVIGKPITPTASAEDYSKYCTISFPSFTTDLSAHNRPRLFNIDFGSVVTNPSIDPPKRGPAVVGSAGDFWNIVAVPWCDHHTKSKLKNVDMSESPITVEMINLGGVWSTKDSLRQGYITENDVVGLVKTDSMLDTFNYPAGNKGGNAYVVLHNVPPGSYDLYIYNKTANPAQYGDYTVTVDSREYGRKVTASDSGSEKSSRWEEGNQYVKFSIDVKEGGGKIQILIRPHTGALKDAQIGGLQLAPAGTPTVDPVVIYQPSSNRPPVITGVSGPTTLRVGETGTWTVNAYDPERGMLTYSVVWGDEEFRMLPMAAPTPSNFMQTATFTHAYARAGIYTVIFYVKDKEGLTAKTTLTVNVGDVGSRPSITVLSPNGGETYKNDGSPITVNWRTDNVPSDYKFDVIRLSAYPNGPEYNLAYNVVNDGQEIVVPRNVPSGLYTVEIKGYLNNILLFDGSDSYFKLVDISQPSITVLSPNGGEKYSVGQQLAIRWRIQGSLSNTVLLEVRKGNNPYIMIFSAAPNTGYYLWTIPSSLVGSNDWRIRITDQNNRSIYDESDATFKVVNTSSYIQSVNQFSELMKDIPLASTLESVKNLLLQLQQILR